TRFDRPFVLREAAANFIDCVGFTASAESPKSGLAGLAMRFASQVGDWLSPTPLYAAHLGFGGSGGGGLPCCSLFTWAKPTKVYGGALGVNVLNSGKDAFTITGKFTLIAGPSAANPILALPFDPSQAVSVGIGTN